jgi:ATP-dependent exoDNAse (exonuclease V) beta subunit
MMAELASQGGCAFCHDGVLWSFPVLAAELPVEEVARAARSACDADAVARADRALEARRLAAHAHARRPFHAVASQDRSDAEEDLARLYGADEEERPPTRRRGGEERERRLARAVGTAVHAGLEHLEPSREIGEQRRRFAAEVEAALPLVIGPEDRGLVRARALELFDRFRAGPLFERLRGLGSRIVARELPVLLAPAGPEDPVGFWSGSIDFLYWDPEAEEYVVADYKTDRVTPGRAHELAAHYRPQGEVYTRAVQAALGLPACPRFELWFLAPGEVVSLSSGRGQAAG